MITRRIFIGLVGLALVWGGLGARAEEARREAVVWRVDAVKVIGGYAVDVSGAPRVADGAVTFDGANDGLLVPANPLAGLKAWTVEVWFRPDEEGAAEQRFWHAQDGAGARVLLETRLDGRGGWWLDTYVFQPGKEGRTLIDPKKIHPTNAWHWVALRFDGKTMAHFVNGVKERAAEVEFDPMGAGKTSIGVRQNKVFWFKGAIREVRVTAEALPEGRLQRGR